MTKFKVSDKVRGPVGGEYEIVSIKSLDYELRTLLHRLHYLVSINIVDTQYTLITTDKDSKDSPVGGKELKIEEKWVTCCLCNKRRYCHQIHNKSDWYCRTCGEAPHNQRNKRGDLM